MKKFCVALLLALSCVFTEGTTVSAEPTSYEKYLIEKAEHGDIQAQLVLGFNYETGTNGFSQNYPKAIKWYEKAALQGDTLAQYSLGELYALGKGVRQSYTKAKQWFEKAAQQGDTLSQNTLGYMYEHRLGVEKNIDEAIKLYKKAADQGHKKAQSMLAKYTK